jgi:hypothetical protein
VGSARNGFWRGAVVGESTSPPQGRTSYGPVIKTPAPLRAFARPAQRAIDLYTRRWTVGGLIGLGFAALLWLFITQTLADPDLWGHLRFGLDMLGTGAVRIADTYSFTSDRAWVNHEWLTEVVMAAAYTCCGVPGLNVLKLAAIGVVAGLLWLVGRQEGGPAWSRNLLAGLTVLATYTRMQVIRPQLFALALFACVLFLMRVVDRGRLNALWGLPACMVCWVNLHGSWIVGLAALGAWIAVRAVTERRHRTPLVIAGLASLAATLVNPYGIGLWRFIFETVRFERLDITEWQPLLALPPLILAVEAILPALAVASIVRTRGRVPLPYVAVSVVLWTAAFRVGRVDAFAQLGLAMLLAGPMLRGLASVSERLRAPFWRVPLRAGPLAACVATIATLAGVWQMREIRVAGAWVPDHQAAVYIREHLANSQMLTWFNWGEYAIWQLRRAGVRVSMDGRRETVYGAEVLARHWSFYRGEPDALDYPNDIGAEIIWLPKDLPVVAHLRSRGWNVAFETPRSIVFAGRSVPQPLLVPASFDPPVFP